MIPSAHTRTWLSRATRKYAYALWMAALIPANGNGTLLWSQAREVDLIPWIATGRRAA